MNAPNSEKALIELEQDKEIAETITNSSRKRKRIGDYWIMLTLVAFILGSASGYTLGMQNRDGLISASDKSSNQQDLDELIIQINPSEGYNIKAVYGDIGPRLLAAGAMDFDEFVQVYERANRPLNDAQLKILRTGSDSEIVFNQQNAYFLLNFFWVLGLVNQNPILDLGPMMRNGRDEVVRFASTGGWSLAVRPISELYSSEHIIRLTDSQQAQLERVVKAIYRPCCNNPTHFPDCNHGMAMLGMLELMAFSGASEDEMFEAAKYANAFWYPKQNLELATFFSSTKKDDFDEVDARQILSVEFSSLSGFQNVHQFLLSNELLPQVSGGGNSCGV